MHLDLTHERFNLQTYLDWLYVYPTGINDILRYGQRMYKNPPIYITENGNLLLYICVYITFTTYLVWVLVLYNKNKKFNSPIKFDFQQTNQIIWFNYSYELYVKYQICSSYELYVKCISKLRFLECSKSWRVG